MKKWRKTHTWFRKDAKFWWQVRKTRRQQQYREQRFLKLRGWQVCWMLVILQCDCKSNPSSMCSQTAGLHRLEPSVTYYVPNQMREETFSEMTQSGFCHEYHCSHTCPQRLFDPLRVLLMLLLFGTSCTTSANEGIFTKAPSKTLTSMFAFDMCKTRVQKTHTKYVCSLTSFLYYYLCSPCRRFSCIFWTFLKPTWLCFLTFSRQFSERVKFRPMSAKKSLNTFSNFFWVSFTYFFQK